MLCRRLDLLEADTSFIWGYAEPFGFDKGGFAFVEREITERDAELCVIDAVVAFLGKNIDMYRANGTRAILAPLNKVAERTGAAIMLVTHVTKGAANRAYSRALGSADFVNAVRSALLVGSDPDDPHRKALQAKPRRTDGAIGRPGLKSKSPDLDQATIKTLWGPRPWWLLFCTNMPEPLTVFRRTWENWAVHPGGPFRDARVRRLHTLYGRCLGARIPWKRAVEFPIFICLLPSWGR